jgi:hypothetical protein
MFPIGMAGIGIASEGLAAAASIRFGGFAAETAFESLLWPASSSVGAVASCCGLALVEMAAVNCARPGSGVCTPMRAATTRASIPPKGDAITTGTRPAFCVAPNIKGIDRPAVRA